MKLKKWNYKISDYEDYNVPDEWNIKSYSGDMEEIINCVQCGKEVKVGETYTSLEVHTEIGFGFLVCSECYEKEHKRRNEASKYL